jgi:hypothetical protein
MTTQITQSVIATNLNCTSDEAYLGLIKLRTTGNSTAVRVPITTLEGRLSGQNIKFNTADIGTSYEDYKMRRKAEVLKYRYGTNSPGIVLTSNQMYKMASANKGGYSSARLKQFAEQNNGNIPDKCLELNKIWIVSTPTQSGVRDYKTPGYYLDPYVAYYPSL